MRKVLGSLLATIGVTSGLAFGNQSEIQDVKIVRTMMDKSYSTSVFIQLDGDPVRLSGHCHTNGTWDYVLSTNSDVGKQMLSQIIAAQAAQQNVEMHGDGSCPVGVAEGLKRIEIYN